MSMDSYSVKSKFFILFILLSNVFISNVIAKEIEYKKALITNAAYSEEYIGNNSIGVDNFFGSVGLFSATSRKVKLKHYYMSLETPERVYLLHYTVRPIFGKYPNWAIGDTVEVAFNEIKSLAYIKFFDSKKKIKMRILKRVRRGFTPRGDLSL